MSPRCHHRHLDAASGLVVTVPYQTTAGGTATAGDDYTTISATDLTFAAGQTLKTFSVTIKEDALRRK